MTTNAAPVDPVTHRTSDRPSTVWERLVYRRNARFLGRVVRRLLLRRLIDIPPQVRIGPNLQLAHGAMGTAVYFSTRIGSDVTLYQHVTIGRKRIDLGPRDDPFDHIEIGDDVLIGAGAAILGGPGVTTVGDGCIIGANAVVLGSTGPWEVWAGNPARKVGVRRRAPGPTTRGDGRPAQPTP